jgi:hypothetical protein
LTISARVVSLGRFFAPGVMRKVYREELVRLDRYAREQAGAPVLAK